jgi:hypothetical protein
MVLLAAVLCLLSRAEAQVRFGLKGGFELTEMNFSASDLREANRVGFYAGPAVKFTLPVVGLNIDASLLYSQRDLKVDGEKILQKSLLLGGDLRYSVGLGDALSIFVNAGPQLSLNVGDDVFYWRDDEQNNHQYALQNTMISFNLGLGVTFLNHFEAGIYYNIPAGKTADFTWDKIGETLKDTSWNRAKSKTNAWHVAVAYYF